MSLISHRFPHRWPAMPVRSLALCAAMALAGCHTETAPQSVLDVSTDQAAVKPSIGELIGPAQRSEHRDGDDLLSAGLGLEGLRALQPPALAQPESPTEAELRRRAIWASWRGIADLRPGEHGEAYGDVAAVPGIETRAKGRLLSTGAEHHMLFQLPDSLARERPCLVVTAASGSRGEYGAIALAGGWGLPRGCAVVYTDKGAGTHWSQQGEVVQVPHATSAQQPDAQWGAFVLAAVEFGLQQLTLEGGAGGAFTPTNTQVLAFGVSNGGAAVLQATGLDGSVFDAVVAVAPNVLPATGGRALYDYATEAALLMPCAMLDARFDQVPFARPQAIGEARCRHLQSRGEIEGATTPEQSAAALARLREGGWTDAALDTAGFSTAFDLWRAVGVTYASSYLGAEAASLPCGYRFEYRSADGQAVVASAAQQALWWSDSTGIPPSAGVVIVDPTSAAAPADDPALAGLSCLRDLWLAEHSALPKAVAATRAGLPPTDLPLYVLHGDADGLVPMAFSSEPYIAWLRSQGRNPVFEPLAGAQHFDAYLGLPQWAGKHPALMPKAYAMMDRAVDALDNASP